MIRNLKILMLVAMALASIGALSATGAQAAKFHCSVAPCTTIGSTDGTGKTAHQVVEVENTATKAAIAITCPGSTGDATGAFKESEELEVAIKYDEGCIFAGNEGSFVKMNECKYNFHTNGQVDIRCPEGKAIEFGLANCTGTVTGSKGGVNQGLEEVKYHNLGTTPNREITIETNLAKIAVKGFDGSACPEGFKPGQGPWVAHYSTGNGIVTGESTPGLVMADLWWE